MKEHSMSRRSFMVKTALMFGGAASVGGGYAFFSRKPGMKKVMFNLSETAFMINPAFRSMESDEGELELFTFLTSGEKLSHTFSGIEAELLSTISSRSRVKGLVSMLAPRYGISEKECRRNVIDSIDELNSAGVVLFGDTHNITVMETTYERKFQGNV